MSASKEAPANVTRRVSTVSLRRLSTGFTHFIRRRSSFFGGKVASKRKVHRNDHILPLEGVRENTLSSIYGNSDLLTAIDPLDIEKVNNNNWFIERFILEHSEDIFGDEDDIIDKSTEHLIRCLLWRAQETISRLTCLDFPLEFYASGIITHGISVTNDSMVFVRAKFFKKSISKWCKLLKQFIAHYYELIDGKLPGADSAIIIVDLTNCQLRHFDMQYVYFIVDLIEKYYPNSCRKLYLANCSWFMRPGLSISLSFSSLKNSNVTSFTTSHHLRSVFDENCLPPFLGGTADVQIVIPTHVAKIEEVARKHGIDEASIVTLRQEFT